MARRRRGIGFPQRAHALVALLAGGSQASFFDGVFMAYRCTAFLRERVWCALDSDNIEACAKKRWLACCKTLDGYFFRVKTCLNGAS